MGDVSESDVEQLAREFDYWDPALGPDPYPLFRAFREECPVVHSEQYGGYYALTRFDDVSASLRDHSTFSSFMIQIPPFPKAPGTALSPPLDQDPPQHTSYRQMLLPFFTPSRTAKLEPGARECARALIDAIGDRPGCDIVTEYAFRMPAVVIANILGVGGPDYEKFERWVEAIVDHSAETDEAMVMAHVECDQYVVGLLEERRTEPKDDLLTFLLTAEVDGQPLTDDQRRSTARLLLIAGIDTTANTLANAIWYLAQNPAARHELIANPALLEPAIEEFLRAYAPVQISRLATTDVEVNDTVLPAGSQVLMSIPSANRDERKFDDAETIALEREPNPHLAFGVGVHRCLGAHIARMELRVGLEEWLRAFPDFELDGGPEAQEWKAGPIRGPKHVKVRFNR